MNEVIAVHVHIDGKHRPEPGTPIIGKILDTSLADAPSTTIAEARGTVATSGAEIATLLFEIDSVRGRPTVWVLVDVDHDGRTSNGDFVTMQSFPVTPEAFSPGGLNVTVRRV